MSNAVKYLSAEWCAQAEKQLREGLSPDILKNATISMTNSYLNCPDGTNKYTYMDIVDGEFHSMVVSDGETPNADFNITADYLIFVQMAKGELSGQKAMMSGSLKLNGNIMKAMKFAPISDTITKVLASIPTEY